jgi:hypothetical protein
MATAVTGILDKLNIPVVVTVLTVIVVCVALLLLYYIVSREVSASSTYTLRESLVPLTGNEEHHLDSSDIPIMKNGTRCSVAFWIFVSDYTSNQGMLRTVFWRGNKDGSVMTPRVFLHENENKLSVVFTPKYVTGQFTEDIGNINSDTDLAKYMAGVYGITIDNIPARRWVHVAVVISDDVNGVYGNGYIDGELVKTVNKRSKQDAIGTVTPVSALEDIDLSLTGDVFTGDGGGFPGFDGFISKISFTNSDLNPTDIYNMYLDTPVSKNLLSKSGYGVRSPLYRSG